MRHACGFVLENQNLPTRVMLACLAHADCRHTVRYTQLSAVPFKEVCRGKDLIEKGADGMADGFGI